MKYCPACRHQYVDVTLLFCLEDGTPLADEKGAQSAIETVAFANPPTAGNILKTEELNLYAPARQADKTRVWRPEPPKSARRSKTGQAPSFARLGLMAGGALLVLAGAGAGGWFYLREQNNRTRWISEAESSTPEIAQKTPTADNSPDKILLDDLSAPANSNSPGFAVSGSEDVKKEIAETIERWKKAAEARKLTDYLSRYAEKVDYFEKTGASLADVRADAQKIFDAYGEIEITLTNLRVAVDAGGTQATAVFDKEWTYETDRDLTEGKAHTKLRFQKDGANWKITGEKYQKIYYLEN